MKLNVENISQFRNPNKLLVKCETQDVTFARAPKDCAPKPDTSANNAMANPTEAFWFNPLYDSPSLFGKTAVGIAVSNLGQIFLSGMNPLLDLVLTSINSKIYWSEAEKLFVANGVIP